MKRRLADTRESGVGRRVSETDEAVSVLRPPTPDPRLPMIDLGVAALLAIVVWMLYHKVLALWFTLDDAYTIHVAVEHRLREYFLDRSVWPQKLYTPLLLVATKWELGAFAIDTTRWYLVQLALTAAAGIALYALLRLYFDALGAAAVSLMFLAAAPLCGLTMALSGVHYFVALVFAALAVAVYVIALRRGRFSLTLLSALLYFVAMLGKETVVPIAILLPFLPERDPRQRVRFAVPHFVTLAAYLALRRAVIGTIAGGYGWAILPEEWMGILLSLPMKIAIAMGGWYVVPLVVIGALLALRNRRALALFVVAMVLAVGPMVPVSKGMQPRFALMPWLVLAIAFAAGVRTLNRRGIAIALLIIAPLATVAANRKEWRVEFNLARRMSDEARFFFFDMPPNGLLRAPAVPPAAMGEVNWLKTVYTHRPGGAGWFYDDFYLCAVGANGKRTWQYDEARRSVIEITSTLPESGANFCGAIRNAAPLSVQFHHEGETLIWHFGPYRDGTYRVLLANGLGAFDVPANDAFRLDAPGITLRVRYQSPAGWVTYSPDFALDFVHHPDTSWHR